MIAPANFRNRKIIFPLCYVLCIIALDACKAKKEIIRNPDKVEVKDSVTKTEVKIEEPQIKKMDSVNITLFMPFSFEEYLAPVTETDDAQTMATQTANALSFYEGFRLAIDSLGNNKMIWNIQSFDSMRDSILVESQLKLNETYDCDLLITQLQSPFNTSAIKAFNDKKCKMIGISQAPPFAPANSFYCLPSNANMIKSASDHIAEKHGKNHIISLYKASSSKEKELSFLFQKNILAANHSIAITQFAYDEKNKDSLISNLSKTKTNLIIMATSDESFVTSVFVKLVPEKEKYKIDVFGMPTWEHFESIDFKLLEEMHTTIFTSQFINYDSDEVTRFRKCYISNYYSEPSYQAFMGFYLASGLCSLMDDHGKDYWKYLNSTNDNMSSNIFKIKSAGANLSFTNDKIFILSYSNYQLKITK